MIRELLKVLGNKFIEKYKKFIVNFSGNVGVFKDFDDDLEKTILNYDISIKCQTCKKVITEEYIEKQLGNSKIYFCCPMCEKYFSYDEHLEKSQRLKLENMHLMCSVCGVSKVLPKHCNKPMHNEIVNGEDKLVCWMGTECGVADIPIHCGKKMEIHSSKADEDESTNPKLYCKRCDYTEEVPGHCRKPMHTENIDGIDKLVSWMGAECGVSDLPKHCGDFLELR